MMQGAKQMDMTFVAPRFMQVGGGSVGRIADLLAKLGLSRPLLVTDPFMVSSGLVQHCLEPLARNGIAVTVFSETIPEEARRKLIVVEGLNGFG